ncbi:MAG: hypothetical protein NTZ44_00255 [Candidatus Nomurabacteria bacterium]|nr:hypothetical protein [Candidatus Nomurabacteria bacterium]
MENSMLKQKFFKVFVPVIAVVAIGLAGYFYSQVLVLKKNPQAVAQKEVTDLVEKVGKLVVLPAGEVPTVATVSDPEALKDQAFFAKAQKGDKVLIYAQAKKAVLYSVLLNKIIDVAPLNIGNTKAVTAPKADTTTTKTDTTVKTDTKTN